MVLNKSLTFYMKDFLTQTLSALPDRRGNRLTFDASEMQLCKFLPFPRAFFGGLSSAQKVWAKHVTRVTETLLLKLHVYFLFKWGFFKSIPLKMIVYLLLKKTQSQTTRCGHHPSSFFGFCFLKNVYRSITNKQKSVHIKRLQLNEAVTKGTHQCIKNPGQDHD